MARRTCIRAAIAAALGAAALAGCVEPFAGANVQIDFGPFTPGQAPPSRAPTMSELPSAVHLRLFAVVGGAPVEIQRFEIHKLVDLDSPCFIDAAPGVPYPGLHVTRYAEKVAESTGISDPASPPAGTTEAQRILAATAAVRMDNLAKYAGPLGLRAVTSASPATYPAPDATCAGTGLPPPMCTDDASNARRLARCRALWAASPTLFEGTDRVLTAPLAGTTFGFVVGQNPVSASPVGGAQFTVADPLIGVDEYSIDIQVDGVAGPGMPFLAGRAVRGTTRGVSQVRMTSPTSSMLTAQLVIFSALDEDGVSF